LQTQTSSVNNLAWQEKTEQTYGSTTTV